MPATPVFNTAHYVHVPEKASCGFHVGALPVGSQHSGMNAIYRQYTSNFMSASALGAVCVTHSWGPFPELPPPVPALLSASWEAQDRDCIEAPPNDAAAGRRSADC